MIVVERKTGYNKNFLRIMYVTVWEEIFYGEGEIRFYDKDISDVVDVNVEIIDGQTTCRIYTYPHNTGDAVLKYSSKEKEIIDLWSRAREFFKIPSRNGFTLDLNEMTFLTEESFTRYSPLQSIDNLFTIFDTDRFLAFPSLYVIQKHSMTEGGLYSDVFPVQCFSSRITAKMASVPTYEGKLFTFRLLNSYRKRKWYPEAPELARISLPTSHNDSLPSFLNTESLLKRAENFESDDLITTAKEVINNSFGDSDNKTILEKIKREFGDKGTVQLSDIFAAGLQETLNSLPTDKIIPINQDISGGFRKACLFESKIHMLPASGSEEFDYSMVFGEKDDLFVVHTSEDSYPKSATTETLVLPSPSKDTRKDYVQ